MSLAPWLQPQLKDLATRAGHAWLLHGPAGLGQYDLALALAATWLCESPHEGLACGTCASCHAIEVRTHADLCVLMPELAMLELGWPLDEKSLSDLDDKKRKPSKEIRVDDMKHAIEFAQRTSARGQGKVVLVFPAEHMNHFTANSLLKTLEEPPGEVRFVLASLAPHQLLPTIRSRCLSYALKWPPAEQALQMAQGGLDTAFWAQLPKAVAQGQGDCFKEWSMLQVIDVLQKVCHDHLVNRCGGVGRFFEASSLTPSPPLEVLAPWSKELMADRATAEHAFNQGLFLEHLLSRARVVLNS